MSDEKRMAGEYEITSVLHIGNREVVMGENLADKEQLYMVAFCECDELFARYYDVQVSSDYVEIVKLYALRIDTQAELVREEIQALDVPNEVITQQDCYRGRESTIGTRICGNRNSYEIQRRKSSGGSNGQADAERR